MNHDGMTGAALHCRPDSTRQAGKLYYYGDFTIALGCTVAYRGCNLYMQSREKVSKLPLHPYLSPKLYLSSPIYSNLEQEHP